MGLLVLLALITLDSSASAGKRIDRFESLQASFASVDTTTVRGCDPLRGLVDKVNDEVMKFSTLREHSPSDFAALVKLTGFAAPCVQDADVLQVISGIRRESAALGAAFDRGISQLDQCRRENLKSRLATVSDGEQDVSFGQRAPFKPIPKPFDFAACVNGAKR